MKPEITVLTLGVGDLERAVRFYRDGLGFATEGVVGQEFENGAVAFFDLQPGLKLAVWPRQSIANDSGLRLGDPAATEFTLGHNVASPAEADAAMAQAIAAGATLVKPAHETFWGGYAGYFQDPDGHLWEVVWNPQLDVRSALTGADIEVERVDPDHAPIELLLEADPSLEKLESYLHRSECWVARVAARTVGAYVVQPITSGTWELMSIAVAPDMQRSGIGSVLLEHAIGSVRESGARRLELGTGSFGHQLAFYQRAGFRVVAVDRDFFVKNYSEPLYENGIQHRDMLRLALEY